MENWNMMGSMNPMNFTRMNNYNGYTPPAPRYELIKVNGEAGARREASRKLDYLIEHVEKEIEHAEEKMMALENSGYDMNYILQEQEPLKAKYANKIRELNMRDYQYRRRGAGNYANYNYDDDEEEDYGYNEYRRYYESPTRMYRRY